VDQADRSLETVVRLGSEADEVLQRAVEGMGNILSRCKELKVPQSDDSSLKERLETAKELLARGAFALKMVGSQLQAIQQALRRRLSDTPSTFREQLCQHWRPFVQSAQQQYEALKQSLRDQGLDPDQYESVRNQLAEKQNELDEITRAEKTLGDTLALRRTKVGNLHEIWRQATEVRRRKANELSGKLSGVLKISVAHQSRWQALAQRLDETGLWRDKRKLSEEDRKELLRHLQSAITEEVPLSAAFAREMRLLLRDNSGAIAALWPPSDRKAGVLKEWFPEEVIQKVETFSTPDEVQVIVCDAHGKEVGDLSHVSTGQRGFAALSLLLAEGEGPLLLDDALSIAERVCAALDHAHRHGVVHRDMKPENIMFDRTGRPIVTDFGVAKVAESPGVTMAGARVGTAHYMSPEQASGATVDYRSDLFSLAVVLYHMLAGRPPFQGDSTLAVMRQVIEEPVPFPRAFNAAIPRSVEAVLMKAPSKKPDKRYQGGEAFAQALRKAYGRYLARTSRRAEAPSDRQEKKRRALLAGLLTLISVAAVCLSIVIYPSLFPRPGKKDGPGTPTPRILIVPRVSQGSTLAEAEKALADAKLAVGSLKEWHHPTVPKGQVVGTEPPGDTPIPQERDVTIIVSLGPAPTPPARVRSVIGMTVDRAKAALRSAGLSLVIAGKHWDDMVRRGCVRTQYPSGGSATPQGKAVRVVLSTGPRVTVPDVVGKTREEAQASLRAVGLSWHIVQPQFHPRVPDRHVAYQTPAAEVPWGREMPVKICLSKGPGVVVPEVRGLTGKQAAARLRALGLRPVPETAYPNGGKVIQVTPPPGKRVTPGTRVKIVVLPPGGTPELTSDKGFLEVTAGPSDCTIWLYIDPIPLKTLSWGNRPGYHWRVSLSPGKHRFTLLDTSHKPHKQWDGEANIVAGQTTKIVRDLH
jgi:serine/threonine-protein kinase